MAKSARSQGAMASALVSGFQPIELPADAAGLDAFDLSGRKVWSYARQGVSGDLKVEFPRQLAAGLLRVRFY